MHTVIRFYAANATWNKPTRLDSIEVFERAGGGGGNADSGGGGGAAVHPRRIRASQLPDTVAIIVGPGGDHGNDGGPTVFGELLAAQPGLGADHGGIGGQSNMRGGNGGGPNQPGRSVTSGAVALLAGGGGGAGSGSTGGASGLVPAGTSHPVLWQTGQSGGGGHTGQPGGYPAGGGGAGAHGAAGLLTLIEYLFEPPNPTP
ncbi:hypothetical protein [Nocardia altamirensis]|uniref:hypothetical protein n=1 Tax=Nocardia altamirensis TaxID=472158 RepID=UPI00084061DB|nr:hypothetical protein [Nocardia altamirensis]